MQPRPLWRRLLCLFGLHRWKNFPPAATDSAYTLARRTCRRCGRWQVCEADPSGWSAGIWRPL